MIFGEISQYFSDRRGLSLLYSLFVVSLSILLCSRRYTLRVLDPLFIWSFPSVLIAHIFSYSKISQPYFFHSLHHIQCFINYINNSINESAFSFTFFEKLVLSATLKFLVKRKLTNLVWRLIYVYNKLF